MQTGENRTRQKWTESLFQENYQRIYQYAMRKAGDANLAEDIVQETFLEAHRKASALYSHENLIGWLYVTADLKCRKVLKKHRQFDLVESQLLEQVISCHEFGHIDLSCSMKSGLSHAEYLLFLEYAFYQIPAKEIAIRHKISENVVKMRVSRIRKKLQKNLDLNTLLR